jgi:hypothetical protein
LGRQAEVWRGQGTHLLEVTTARGSQQYRDSFYSCFKFPDPLPFVDNIDHGFEVLLPLAHP